MGGEADAASAAPSCRAAGQDAFGNGGAGAVDGLFRVKKKNGALREVEAPRLGVELADAHTHLHLLESPALALARAGLHDVGFLCTVLDVSEDDEAVFGNVERWRCQAALLMRRAAGGG